MRPLVIGVLGVGLAFGFLGQAGAEPIPCVPEDPHCRAGNPQDVAWWARPSNTRASVGYYVGGGCPFPHLGEPRCLHEGTWGWDYQGYLIPRRVILGWWHGRCYQGGIEGYKVDGPPLENPLNKD